MIGDDWCDGRWAYIEQVVTGLDISPAFDVQQVILEVRSRSSAENRAKSYVDEIDCCVTGGPPPPRNICDYDRDGDVDIMDVETLFNCYTCAGGGVPAACSPCDVDGLDNEGDNDVDLIDYATLQTCYGETGPHVPSASTASVTFTLEPTGGTVLPTAGGTVPFRILATVSDGDNNGLALFGCDIMTNSETIQPGMDESHWRISSQNNLDMDFIDVTVNCHGGVSNDPEDDLIQVGAAQHLFIPWFSRLGYGQATGIGAGQEVAQGYIEVGPGDPAAFKVWLGYCKATVIKSEYDHASPVWPAVEDVADANLVIQPNNAAEGIVIRRGLPGDFDQDDDVDLIDYATFQSCYSGHGNAYSQGCSITDLDADGDVDALDFAEFQRNITGPQ